MTHNDLAGKRLSTASIGDVLVLCTEPCAPTFSRPSGGWGGPLDNYDLIEILDLTGAFSKDPLDLSFKPAQDLKGTELDTGGNVRCFWLYSALNNGLRSRTDSISQAATVEAVERKMKVFQPSRNCCSVPEKHKSHNK